MCDRVQRFTQLVRDGQAKRLRIFAGTLFRHEFDAVADQVPPAELDQVRASDTQIQHQFHCKPGHGAERIGCAIARQLGFAPGMETGRLMDFGHAVRWIECRQLRADGPIEERLQVLHQLVGRAGSITAFHLALLDVALAHLLKGVISHHLTVAIENALFVLLRGRRVALESL
ncbi:hypothetical protein [Rhizobium sp. BK538]|uniref:hypothetical protein n=1 Tax=Rhizobium sp. BK538 TaxID=2586984 RepID=UPI001FEF7B01|nr:hypothetical protein [Rhizobium sp. BK538]